jgi:aminoglycoside phosphotransferase (APT) family kinase protein
VNAELAPPDRAVLDAVLAELGLSSADVEVLPGGAVNRTVRVRAADQDVVVRVPIDPLAEDVFPVEAWATAAAGRAGIAVAPVLRHGDVRGTPFMVSEYVEPHAEPVADPWRALGEAARAVAAVRIDGAPPSLFSRFGPDLPAAWRAHVAYNVRSLVGDDPLLQDGAYASAAPLLRVFGTLGSRPFRHGLAHGDLAPRNLVPRGPGLDPVLIDWGSVETGPAPWTDARRVTLWRTLDGSVSAHEHDVFMAAAGLLGDDEQRTLVAMTALHLVDVARWARERRPDRYHEDVARCREGLRRFGFSD